MAVLISICAFSQESNIGPRPAAYQAEAATAAPTFLQSGSNAGFSGATLSAAPNPEAQAQAQAAQLAAAQQQQAQYGSPYQQYPNQQQQGYPVQQAGQTRTAEQSEESNKRQRQ